MLDETEFRALDPLVQKAIDAMAKALYLRSHGWQDQPNSGYWEQELNGYHAEQSDWVVAEFRRKAMDCLEALIGVMV